MRMKREGFVVVNEQAAVTYHCVSRVVDGTKSFGAKEKAVFVKIMREYEDFCGIEVLTYCVMRDHFQILAHVPQIGDLTLKSNTHTAWVIFLSS